MLDQERTVLDKLYQDLEQISNIGILESNIIQLIDSPSTELRFIISVEYNVRLKFNTEHINRVFGLNNEKVKLYLVDRIRQTSNIYLKSKYLHFLYLYTKNNKYCSQAIEVYQKLLTIYLKNQSENHNTLHFYEVLEIIISLSETTKNKTEELKKQIIDYLNNPKVINRIKTHIIQAIAKSNLFKVPELSSIPQLCITISKYETESNWIEINLELGLLFALKFPKNQNQIREIFELLGNNECQNIRPYDGKPEDIIIPHYNQSTYAKMMGFYKNAKNIVKLEEATRLYNSNKKNLKFLKITSRIELKKNDDFIESLNSYFESIINQSTPLIIVDLCLGYRFLFMPNNKLAELAEVHTKKSISGLFTPVAVDINVNTRSVELFDFYKFQLYSVSANKSLQFVISLILKSIKFNKLSYSKLINELNKRTFLGKNLVLVSNNVEISYTWVSEIDFALKSFFSQCNLLLKDKKADWRITIETLSLKFEGILRDIIGIECGCITKIDKSENTTEMLLDDLLRCDCFSTVFDEDDKNLFLYTFTNKGLNIRNNVAHSFYKSYDYTFDKAVLVLLCVLRLAKFYPTKKTEPITEQTPNR